MATHERTEPVYMIGVVANLTQMHAQTIRLYERLGLVTPLRKNKNRLYSESDVERLRQIGGHHVLPAICLEVVA